LLSGGTQFLSDLAYECVRNRYGTRPPEDLEQLVIQLRTEFKHYHLVDLLERIRTGESAPLVVIDHFECLAIKLRAEAWASVRYLLEQRLLQMVLLSRLSIAEVEKLADSKFGQTIKQEILPPFSDAAKRRSLAALPFNGTAAPDAVLDYIGELAGGHRSLTLFLAERVAAQCNGFQLDRAFVDQVIAAYRDEMRSHLADIFRGLDPSDDGLRSEFEGELRCAFEVDHAPGFIIEIQSFSLQRLRRLGHLQVEAGSAVRFSSELLRSELRRRWLQDRNAPRMTSGYSEWLEYDELLRRLIRARGALPVSELLARAGNGCKLAFEAWERDRRWWGAYSGDLLDELRAEDLHDLLQTWPNIVEPGWCEQRKKDLDLVSAARRPISSVPWELWPPERRHEALQALGRLHADVSRLLADAPAHFPAPVLIRASGRRTVRWLHVSDAHFHRDRPYGENKVVNSFLTTLRQQRSLPETRRLGPAPDLVFFTGDIAYSGRTEEYERARDFFDELLKLLDLDRDRLFFIPGNHDVDRGATHYLERSLKNPESAHKAFKDPRWRRLYAERLTAYFEFSRSYFEGVPERQSLTENGFTVPQRIRIRDVEILIHLLNSQWCGGLQDDLGSLVLGLSLLHEELELTVGTLDADLRLALMHQPIHHLAEFEQESFLLLSRHLDATLRGHLHRSEVTRMVTTRGDLTEFSAGALFSDPEHDNAAQFVEIDVDSRSYAVYPIRYEPKQFRWERDTSLGEAPDYIYKGQLLPRRR
jgi:predicted MPP superfamily phosphohydrolase